jgi:hypothetical protein
VLKAVGWVIMLYIGRVRDEQPMRITDGPLLLATSLVRGSRGVSRRRCVPASTRGRTHEVPARRRAWRRRAQLWSDRESVEQEEEGVEQAADVHWGAHHQEQRWEVAEVNDVRQGTSEEGGDEQLDREQERAEENKPWRGPTLRVLNFNAQEYKSEWRRRFKAFGALVNRTKPHLIAVQVRIENEGALHKGMHMLDWSSDVAACTVARVEVLVVESVLRRTFAVAEESIGFEGQWRRASHPTVLNGVWISGEGGAGYADEGVHACWLGVCG